MTYDDWKSTEPNTVELEPEPCGDCGGQGFYCVATEDDEMADREYVCEACGGSGEERS